MHSIVLPAHGNMSCALTRITRITGNSSHGHHHLTNTWKSIWNRFSGHHDKTTQRFRAGLSNNGITIRTTATASTSSSSDHYAASPNSEGPRICILGGGFGGLYTAVKLEGLLWPRGTKPRVTLIDQAERFTFKPLLYELITGTASSDEVAPSYAQLLANYPVTFIQGRVAAVTPENTNADGGSDGGGTVVLASGEALQYDWLVLALGAETNTYGIPGVKEYAVPFSSYSDAQRVVSKLESLSSSTNTPEIVIVGGGYAGVELAAAIADRLGGRGRIQLVTSSRDILEGGSEGQRDAANRALKDNGVSVLANASVLEVKIAAMGMHTDNSTRSDTSTSTGAESLSESSTEDSSIANAKRLVYVKDAAGQTEILEADIVLWVAGQAPVPIPSQERISSTVSSMSSSSLRLPFPTDTRGCLSTEPTLRVLHNKKVFALGDVAVTEYSRSDHTSTKTQPHLPATAQVAFQQADYVAWNLWASLNNKPLLRFSYQHLGDMMSLGSTKGAVSLPIPVPPPLSAAAQAGPLGEVLRLAGVKVMTTYGGESDGITVEGPLAALMRRAAYLYRQPTDQQRLKVASSWLGEAGKTAVDLARQVVSGRSPSSTNSGTK